MMNVLKTIFKSVSPQFLCSGNFQSCLKQIFGISENTQNQFSLLEIFGDIRKRFLELPKMTEKAKWFCIFSD
jgi:hypothetical protein